jgi:hypothetical protein
MKGASFPALSRGSVTKGDDVRVPDTVAAARSVQIFLRVLGRAVF